jgi:hypothetical protein
MTRIGDAFGGDVGLHNIVHVEPAFGGMEVVLEAVLQKTIC